MRSGPSRRMIQLAELSMTMAIQHILAGLMTLFVGSSSLWRNQRLVNAREKGRGREFVGKLSTGKCLVQTKAV